MENNSVSRIREKGPAMSDDQARALDAQARKLAYDLTHRDTDWKCCIDDAGALPIIVTALQQAQREARQAVWEAVIEHIAKQELLDVVPVQTRDEERTYRKLVSVMKWCREQAKKEVQP